MSTDVDSLKEVYLNVAGDAPVIEQQQEEPSRDPVDTTQADLEEEVSAFAREHGLDDALEGLEAGEN